MTYPVLSLPPEILTEVFINFLPSYPDYPPLHGIFSPLLLCQICRQWRAVALSTPLLWRAIQVELTRGTSDKQLAAQLELLKTWLRRSGNCPLSLSLTHARNITHRLVPQFLRAVMAHCRRWEHLDVLMPFEHMHLLHGDMPLLRTLTFGPSNFPHGRRSRSTQTPFHAAPQLKRVILTRNFFTSVTALPWAQLTHLEADCLYERECLEILRDAPLLVAGTFRLCHPPGAEPILPPNPWPSALPAHTCLRDLVLDADGEFLGVGATILPQLSTVLDRLTLPALCTLLVAEPCITLESLAAFIARSGCYMENLCIAGASLPEPAYRAALPPFDKFRLEP